MSEERTPALVISGSIVIDPAHVDRARQLVAPLIVATRAEPGCLAYGFYADLDEPGAFHLYEEWESAEANAAHSASAHLATFMAGIAELDVRHVRLDRYEVAGAQRIM
ncbi:MAG TPA: antibiotic biosynthesis monooxygenase [Iamia sp.]|nr:antibiotic biosynthesis monooxygenase [Iamia sp.]